MSLQVFSITHSSEVAHARRGVSAIASRLGFNDEDVGRVALVATEICTNALKHADGGMLLARAVQGPAGTGLELVGLDRGPGIADLARSLQDGYSTAGSPGTGLGAIDRMSQRFDIYSKQDKGTAVLAEIWQGSRAYRSELDIGAIVVAKSGEAACGDTWCCLPRSNGFAVLAVDGLGHGHHAAQAASEACRVFESCSKDSPAQIVQRMHEALRPTRGAAVALVEVDWHANVVIAAGIGNIVAAVAQRDSTKRIALDNGIVGHTAQRFRELTYPWSEDAVLLLHSDGVSGSWQLDRYPGLLQHSAPLVAGVLYRDFNRARDDALVVVIKRAMP
jgi:anti-sigma regulatory factor (Ser/Thr protein kinase)